MMSRLLLVLAATMGLVQACSDARPSEPDTTVPTAAPTSSSSTLAPPPNVAVIPSAIDAAYVNAVFAALDEVDAQATRIIKRTKRVPPEATDLLRAIYGTAELEGQVDAWYTSIAEDPELQRIHDPGRRRTTVERFITASPACIYAAVRRDYSQVAADPTPGPLEYVSLQPLDQANNPRGYNDTAWMITTDGYRDDGAEPRNPCSPG